MPLTPEEEKRLAELNARVVQSSPEPQEESPEQEPYLASSNFGEEDQSRLAELNARASQPQGLAAENLATAQPQPEKLGMIEQGMDFAKRGARFVGETIKEHPLELAGAIGGGVAGAGLALTNPAFAATGMVGESAMIGAGAATGRLIEDDIKNFFKLVRGQDVSSTKEVVTGAVLTGAINMAAPFVLKGAGKAVGFGIKGLASQAGISGQAQEIIMQNPRAIGKFLADASVEQAQGFAKSVAPIMEGVQDTARFAYENLIENGLVASKGKFFNLKTPASKSLEESLTSNGFRIVKKPAKKEAFKIFDPAGKIVRESEKAVAKEEGIIIGDRMIVPQEGVSPRGDIKGFKPLSKAKKAVQDGLGRLLAIADDLDSADARAIYNFQREVTDTASEMFESGNDAAGQSMMKVLKTVRKFMDDNVPEFREANSVWEDAMTLKADAKKLTSAVNPIQTLKIAMAKATRTGDAIKSVMQNPKMGAFKDAVENALKAVSASQMAPPFVPKPTGHIGSMMTGGAMTGSSLGPVGTALGGVAGLGTGIVGASPRITGTMLRAMGFGQAAAKAAPRTLQGAMGGVSEAGTETLRALVEKFRSKKKK